MDFDANSLFASLLVSGVGFVIFVYGRKMGRLSHLLVGFSLLVFPYFVTGVLTIFAIGAALLAALWLAVKVGW